MGWVHRWPGRLVWCRKDRHTCTIHHHSGLVTLCSSCFFFCSNDLWNLSWTCLESLELCYELATHLHPYLTRHAQRWLSGEQLFFGDKHREEQPHARPTVFEVPVRVGLAATTILRLSSKCNALNRITEDPLLKDTAHTFKIYTYDKIILIDASCKLERAHTHTHL